MAAFLVPDDFRAFMRAVAGYLDAPSGDKLLDSEAAFRDECGYGGRIDGSGMYRFSYLTVDGVHRWTIVLDELEIRAISDGLQIEAEGERSEIVRTRHRKPSGDPLLIWGAYNDDALVVRSLDDLVTALDILQRYAADKPRILRVWSPSDDQLVAVICGELCALYVIESIEGYATSTGDRRRTDSFEAFDHDDNPLIVPWADCVAWPAACRALIRFATHGDLGTEVRVEGRIPSQLLMHGELDRQAVLAVRAEPASDPRRSSLPRLTAASTRAGAEPVTEPAIEPVREPVRESIADLTVLTGPMMVEREPMNAAELAGWGRRLIQVLFNQGLVELGAGPGVDEISYQLSGHLQAHGDEAEHSLEVAEWLAHELGSLRGIAKLFATAGDLQLALRRSRYPE
jgi:hypothetical protein